MPDEVVPQGAVAEPAAPAAPVAEPRNVREAIAQRVAGGIPEITNVPDEPVTPAEPAAADPAAEFIADHTTGAAADPAVPAEVDPFAEYGGQEEVANAITLAQAMRTEQGARVITAQLLTSLGYDVNAVREVLESKGATPAEATAAAHEAASTPADPLAGVADDDVVTAADVRALLKQVSEQTAASVRAELQQATQPLADQLAADRQRIAAAATDSTLVELLGQPPADPKEAVLWQTEAQAVLAQAAIGFDPNQWDPAYIRQQVIRGHAAHEAESQRRLAAYAARKAADRAKAPTHVGGAQAASNEALVKEPKSVKEAIAMRKEAGIF